MTTAHFIRHMKEEQAVCGLWLITMDAEVDAVVYNIRFETPEKCRDRGQHPCVTCVERIPLLDLGETEL